MELKKCRIIGKCKKCGGNVRLIIRGRVEKEWVCERCGEVNGRIGEGMEEERVIRAMREAFEQLRKRGIMEPDGRAFARIVEYLVGVSIPDWMWRKESGRWLREAGLEVWEGRVRERRE